MSKYPVLIDESGEYTFTISSPYAGISPVEHTDRANFTYRQLAAGLFLSDVALEKGFKLTGMHAFDASCLKPIERFPCLNYYTMDMDNRRAIAQKSGSDSILQNLIYPADQEIIDAMIRQLGNTYFKYMVRNGHRMTDKQLQSYGTCVRICDEDVVKRFVLIEKHFSESLHF